MDLLIQGHALLEDIETTALVLGRSMRATYISVDCYTLTFVAVQSGHQEYMT